MPPSSLSKARTYLSISLGKSTSWIANVKANRSSRPPPKACSRQVSTDETRKQVRATMKMMAMMNIKALVTIDSSSSIALKTNYVRLRWWKLLFKTRFIMRNHVLGFQLFCINPELDALHGLITIFLFPSLLPLPGSAQQCQDRGQLLSRRTSTKCRCDQYHLQSVVIITTPSLSLSTSGNVQRFFLRGLRRLPWQLHHRRGRQHLPWLFHAGEPFSNQRHLRHHDSCSDRKYPTWLQPPADLGGLARREEREGDGKQVWTKIMINIFNHIPIIARWQFELMSSDQASTWLVWFPSED